MNATKEEIIELLRERVEDLCHELLPGGKREGHRWVCGSVNGEAGKSMHVELRGPKTGMWNDFAGGGGGDVLKLIELSQNLPGYKEVMDWARGWLGLPAFVPEGSPQHATFDPLRFTFKDRYGDRAWAYRSTSGEVIGYVVRFTNGDGKDIIPLRIIDGKPKWKGWTGEEKKPIYNVDHLARRPGAPLLIVEGEKTCDAARKLFPDRVCLTWQGGSKAVKNADWKAVVDHVTRNQETPGFNVVVWPDADDPGRSCARYLRTLMPLCHVVDTHDLPLKWDLADDPPEDIDLQAMVDAALLGIEKPKKASKQKVHVPEDVIVVGANPMRGEIPQPFELRDEDIPDGASWESIRHDYNDYGVFFHQYQLWAKRTEQNKQGEVTRIYFQPITNFSLEIITHMEDEKISAYLVRMINVRGRRRVFDAPTDMLLSVMNLKKWALGKGNYTFTGTQMDFDRLVSKLLNEMGEGQKIDVLGWQTETRVFAMNDALITAKGEVLGYDEYGCCEIDGAAYYVPSANRLYRKNPYRFLPQKRFRYVDGGVNFERIAAKLVQVHREHGQIGLVFMVAALFSDRVFAQHGFFPMTFLYGEPSTGKSHMSKVMQHFIGDPQEAMQVTGKSTDKAKIRKFAQFVNGLVVLEEFSNTIGDGGFQWLKGLNDRNGYERGTIDSNFGTDNVPITSAVILTGNDYPQNDALLTRLVVIEMLKNTFTDKEKEAFAELTDLMEKGYSSVIAELYTYREHFDAEYKQHYREALVDMTQALTLEGVSLERMVQNPSVLMAVYRFFETRLKWPMTRTEFQGSLVRAMVAQNNKRDTGGDVAKWWACIQAAIKAEDLFPGEDYKIDGDNFYIRFNDCHEQYLVYFQKLFRSAGHVAATMRTKLEKSPAFKQLVKQCKFAGVNTSAYVFSFSALGDEFTSSVLMKRVGKHSRRGSGPPPDNHGSNGSDGGPAPSPAPAPKLELQSDDLPF